MFGPIQFSETWNINHAFICIVLHNSIEEQFNIKLKTLFHCFTKYIPRLFSAYPVDTGRKLNVHKTFRRRPGPLLNVLCTFSLRPVSTGY